MRRTPTSPCLSQSTLLTWACVYVGVPASTYVRRLRPTPTEAWPMSHAHPRPAAEAVVSAAPRANAVVAVLAFGGIVVSLMKTLVIPIVPELPKLLNSPASDTAWAVTATLLAAAVAVPMMG